MNKRLHIVLGLTGLVAAGGLVTGGYFLFSNSNKYNGYYTNPIIDNPNGLVSAYNGARERGAEVILTPGFNHQAPIESTFEQYPSEFKNTGFLLYDSNVTKNTKAAYNTWSITFRTDLGSIKVGVAIAYFLNYYQDWFATDDDGKLTWATWGGLPYSSVTSYMGGLQKGIQWANENLKGKTIHNPDSNKDFTYKEVQQIFDPQGSEFTKGFGESNGMNLQMSLVNARPDVLIPVAGPQIWSAQNLIKNLKDSKTILIGVDSACEDDPRNLDYISDYHGKPIGNGKRVQFSSLKRLDYAGEKALSIINNGNKIPETTNPDEYNNFTTPTGETGFGTCAVGDIKNNCVGISEAGLPYFDDAFKLSGLTQDPALDPKYSEVANMQYVGDPKSDDPKTPDNESIYNYGAAPFGLAKECTLNVSDTSKILNKNGFIKKDDQADANKIKVILSQSNAILMDASFSQSCYVGLYTWYKSMGIEIPKPIGGK